MTARKARDRNACATLWHPRARGQNGFTLLEMMVAVVIVGMCLAVFFQLLSSSMGLEMKARQRLQELLWARQIFENFRSSDIRADDLQWEGQEAGYTWALKLYQLELDDEQLLLKDQGWEFPESLFMYSFTFQENERIIADWRIYKTYPEGYFEEGFLNSHVQDIQKINL